MIHLGTVSIVLLTLVRTRPILAFVVGWTWTDVQDEKSISQRFRLESMGVLA